MRTMVLFLVIALLLTISFGGLSAQAQTYTQIHAFTGEVNDGGYPFADLRLAGTGTLYGTTWFGGAFGLGTVFKSTATGRVKVLYSFTSYEDGFAPGNLVKDGLGNLYGTTVVGGGFGCDLDLGCGTIFKLDKTGIKTTLYIEPQVADGLQPAPDLVRDKQGNLYGIEVNPTGSCNPSCGTIFKLDPSGQHTVLYTFAASGGYGPGEGLVRDSAGNLYGQTGGGGDFVDCSGGCGTVFKLDTTGHFSTLYAFTGRADGGRGLVESGHDLTLIRDSAGNLYGTVTGGGDPVCQCGVIFKVDSTGKETVLYTFTGGADGEFPLSSLSRDAAGNLYGTTYGDPYGQCNPNCGTVYKLDPAGHLTVLHTYMEALISPNAVVVNSAGTIFGSTLGGGVPPQHLGTIFKISP